MSAKRRKKREGDETADAAPAEQSAADKAFSDGLKEFDRAQSVVRAIRKRIQKYKEKGNITTGSIRALLNAIEKMCGA